MLVGHEGLMNMGMGSMKLVYTSMGVMWAWAYGCIGVWGWVDP